MTSRARNEVKQKLLAAALLSTGLWFVPGSDLLRKFGCRGIDDCLRRTSFVDILDHLGEIILHGCNGGDDGRSTEAVRDEREVGEMTLERWIQDGHWTHRPVR